MNVVMCGSDINRVKGGMVSVSKGFLEAEYWKDTKLTYVTTHRETGKIGKIVIFLSGYFRILILLFSKQVDIVLCNVSERGSVYRKAYIMKLCHLFHVPVIFHHHGAEFNMFYSALSDRKKMQINEFITEADLNLVLSESQIQDLLDKAPHAKVKKLYNSVDLEKNPYIYKEDNFIIATFGRLGERKGTWDLLDVIAEIRNKLGQDVKIALCGDGLQEEAMLRAKRLGIEDLVVHCGWISGKEKEQLLSNVMIHVLPSYREVLPMSILETMAAGIPNISTSIASIPEVIDDHVNGILIKAGDKEALKQSICLLLSDADLRERYSKASREKIENAFSLEKNIYWLENQFKDLIATGRNNTGV